MVLDVSPTDATPSADDDAILGFDDGLVEQDVEEPQEEPDPLAEIRAELAATKAELDALKGWKNYDPERLARAVLQVPALQRDFEEIRKQGATPQADPRVSEVEEHVLALTDALINSDLLDDASKASLRTAKARVDSAKTERQTEQRLRELVAQLPGAQQPAQPVDDRMVYAAQLESVRLQAYAEAKGVDFATLGDALKFLPNETMEQAAVRVRAEIDRLAGEPAVDRVAERRRAAGNGTPARSGTTMSESALTEAMANGTASPEQRKAFEEYMRRAGVSI